MTLTTLDWLFIAGFFALSLVIGLIVSRKSGQDSTEFFLSGRNMPWWLLGVSMVATTFSADTPNLVTDIVRKNGVSGNWVWWAFLLTGMLTVFVYARLWRRSGVLTDLAFYELRYSGKEAAFLRGFRALYLGVFFNVMVMATVCLAAIKIGSVMLGLSGIETLLIASIITVAYSTLGGLRGIIYTDFFQFGMAMIGTIWAAYIIVNLPQVGGLENLLAHENVADKLNLLPDFNDKNTFFSLMVIPLAVQWWAAYYPGAEPGGGGYIAQRMLAAKDEKNAMGATLLFNVAHYALRPWPWILIALASLIVFPDHASIQAAFPNVPAKVINDDLAYPAMLTFLPSGLVGLVLASLIGAFMSTISTHLNWGSSYIANDFYKRFINKDATNKDIIKIGRISTLLLMILAAALALLADSALGLFNVLLQIGAGTGLLFILRWFWWRINAYSELSAMIISFLVALGFLVHAKLGYAPLESSTQLFIGVIVTTIGWLATTFMTRPTDTETLVSFYNLTRPAATGWKPILASTHNDANILDKQTRGAEGNAGQLPLEILGMFVGCFTVYGALFATGYWIYGNTTLAIICTAIGTIGSIILFRIWGKLQEIV